MLEEGATTCMEVWGKEQKFNTSLCHPWASAPIPVLIEDIIGLTPSLPGWKEIDFHPNIPWVLEHLNIEIEVKTGKIKVLHDNKETKVEGPEGIKINT